VIPDPAVMTADTARLSFIFIGTALVFHRLNMVVPVRHLFGIVPEIAGKIYERLDPPCQIQIVGM